MATGFKSRKVEEAVRARLRPQEQIAMVFNGMSTGLNKDRGNAGKASICLTGDAVIVGWEGSAGILARASAERFEYSEIMRVADGDAELTGIQGAAARKNATSPIGRMLGYTGSAPAVFLTTRRGDLAVTFGKKERGVAREAMVAIGDQLEGPSR